MKVITWLRSFTRSLVDIEGIKIKIPAIASKVIRNSILDGSYEAPELKLVKSRLSQEDIVMEVGTGLGLLSVYCAKQIGDDKVFTFEANPALEEAIKTNYQLNQVAPKLEMALVGDRPGFTTFYVGKNFWSNSIFNKAKGAKPITVTIVSFNDRVKEIKGASQFCNEY
ncbi:FkbM family methyltransferase [Synechocystis sp. PCC 7509]|uniref:FkbM family methyltransferase n=1 Tax=Synechocystis sp. PCC 7509 TaxID=927677 RepID=UPI0002ABEDF5|nr:FkbM family methyltransferase [Synechocystis sp. PCC 7509]